MLLGTVFGQEIDQEEKEFVAKKKEKIRDRQVSIQLNDKTIVRPADGMATSPKVIDHNHASVVEGMLRLRRAC